METTPLHLVIRFSDTMFGVGDVVALHNKVADHHGAVWFGKLGGTLSQSRIDVLNKQIEKKTPTVLYLVKERQRNSTPYWAFLPEKPSRLAWHNSAKRNEKLLLFLRA